MKNKFLALLIKEKAIISSCIGASICLFLAYVMFLYVPMYSTTAKLFVKNIEKPDIVATYGGGPTVASESGYSNPLFNLVQILGSETMSSNLYNVLSEKYPQDFDKLGIKSKEKWTNTYPKLLKARIEPSTDIIKVSFSWPDKFNAKNILEETIDQFKITNLEIKKSIETSRRKYLDKQLVNISNQLKAVRQQIRDYKLAHKAVDIENESTELTRAKVDLQKEAEILKSDIVYANKKRADLAAQLNVPDARTGLRATAIGYDPYLTRLDQDLAGAEQNRAKLQAKFTDNFPDVIAAKNEINVLRKNILNRKLESLENISIKRGIYDKPSQDVVTELARVESEAVSLKARLRMLNRGVGNLTNKENMIPSKLFGLSELRKQEDSLLVAYSNIKQKQLEAKIKENEIIDNIFPLDNPSTPISIMSVILIKLLGFLSLGLVAGLGIALLKEDIEDKWIDSEEIETVTGKKVLGVIPWLKPADFATGDKTQNSSIMDISHRHITSNIISRSDREQAQVLSAISTIPKRTKSSILPNIAATLAKLNRSVIVIDTDFASPSKILKYQQNENYDEPKDLIDAIQSINKYLRVSKTINDQIIGNILKSALITVNVEAEDNNEMKYYYLSSNKVVDNIHDYVASQGFATMVEFLKRQYEFVLIDTPAKPIIFPEFSSIANVSDAVILISGLATNRESLVKHIDNFEKSNTKVLGIIPRVENSDLERYFSINKSDIAADSAVKVPEEISR